MAVDERTGPDGGFEKSLELLMAFEDFLEGLLPESAPDPSSYFRLLFKLCKGYSKNPVKVLRQQTGKGCGLVAVEGIPFVSLCRKHLVPFSGEIDLVYSPDRKVFTSASVGRLVTVLSRRLQTPAKLARELTSVVMKTDPAPFGCSARVDVTGPCVGCGRESVYLSSRGDMDEEMLFES